MISVLILTKNEEQDLPACLESVKWSDDIHIYDSYSEDATIGIAKSFGANVWQRQFDGYASQRNAALTTINYKYEWLLILDADERIPEELSQEMLRKTSESGSSVNGFRIRRKDYLNNTWLKHAQISPYYIRLVRKGKASYHREINEVLEVEGVVDQLDNYFDHYPFSKGFSYWLAKHNQYSSMEAERWIVEHEGNEIFSIEKALFAKDFSQRRYHQKGLFYKLPGRPVLKWIYMVVFRRAFLDGRAGLIYATLQSIYEYFIVLKSREILNQKKQLKKK